MTPRIPLSLARSLMTLAIASVGIFIFTILDLPLPWLLGPLLACLIAAFAQAPMNGLGVVATPLRTILGVAVGAAITPALFHRIDEMALSMALIPLLALSIGLAGVPYFHRAWGFDRATSYYCVMPGGLQDMLVFGEEAGGNVRIMSLIHATRVLIVVVSAPLLLTYAFGVSLSEPPGAPARDTPVHEMLIMLACAIIGWKGGKKIGLFGASILGPLILTAAASLLDIIHHRPPIEAILIAQLSIGVSVGAHYVGITWAEFRRVVLAAALFTFLMMGLAAIPAALIIWLGSADAATVMLAFLPGGQAELTVLAIVSGVDVAYVVVHHIFRMIIVIIGAPLAMRWMGK